VSSSDEDGAEESSHTQPNLAPTGSRQPLTDCLPNVVEPFGVKEHCANLENKILKDALPVLDTPVCIIHQSSKIDASVSYQGLYLFIDLLSHFCSYIIVLLSVFLFFKQNLFTI